MKRLLMFGVALIFLAGSWGAAFAAEDKKDGIPKSTKDKWIEQKKDKIDKDAADKKAKVVAPGMRAVDQAGADRKIQEIDDQAKQQKKQVDEDANKLGDGKPIYKPKDKTIKDPKPVKPTPPIKDPKPVKPTPPIKDPKPVKSPINETPKEQPGIYKTVKPLTPTPKDVKPPR